MAMEENFFMTLSTVNKMADRTERFLPKFETPADNTAPLRQAPPFVAILRSPANNCVKIG